jgi:hypothetical protein
MFLKYLCSKANNWQGMRRLFWTTEPKIPYGKVEAITSKSFTVAIMDLLTVTEYLCHKWPRTGSIYRNHNLFLSLN